MLPSEIWNFSPSPGSQDLEEITRNIRYKIIMKRRTGMVNELHCGSWVQWGWYCDMTPESQNNGTKRNRPLGGNGW
jgi:hypothetical protein